jgi:hypothetical protein
MAKLTDGGMRDRDDPASPRSIAAARSLAFA